MSEWTIEDEQAVASLDEPHLVGADDAPQQPLTAPIAVTLHDIVVHDNKKWTNVLGGAAVRIDVLTVQGNLLDGDPTSFYTPTTRRFDDIGDEAMLPLDEHGLLAYYGWPKHFLDISVLVSRDTARADDLATLLAEQATAPALTGGLDSILQLVTSGGALAIRNALSGAALLGSFAYKVLRQVSGSTIGVYHGNRLEYPHRFGQGRNPPKGSYRQQDMSLRFDVFTAAETAPTTS